MLCKISPPKTHSNRQSYIFRADTPQHVSENHALLLLVCLCFFYCWPLKSSLCYINSTLSSHYMTQEHCLSYTFLFVPSSFFSCQSLLVTLTVHRTKTSPGNLCWFHKVTVTRQISSVSHFSAHWHSTKVTYDKRNVWISRTAAIAYSTPV